MPSLSHRLLEALAADGDIELAVETGTYLGDGARLLATYFPRVITVERDPVFAREAAASLSGLGSVEVVHAHSAEYLRSMRTTYAQTLFFLDGHWSGGATAGVDDQCPVMAELNSIADLTRTPCVVIDDARLFLSPPPAPLDPTHWPSVQELLRFVDRVWPDALVVIIDDRIIIVGEDCKDRVRKYAHSESDEQEATRSSCFSILRWLRAAI